MRGAPATRASTRVPARTSARPSRRTSAGTAPRSATATCATARWATRAPTATPSGCTTTRSMTTRWGSRRTSSPPRPSRLPAGLRPARAQRHLLEQLQRVPAPVRRRTAPGPERADPGLLRCRPQRPGAGRDGDVDRGRNANVVRHNRFYDNWRRGAMLFQVPDQFVCDDPDNQVAGCDPRRPCRRRRIATGSPRTRWAWLRTAASSGTAWTSGGTRRHLRRPDAQHGELLVQQHGPRRHGGERQRHALAERHPAEQPPDQLPPQPIGRRHERADRRGIDVQHGPQGRPGLSLVHHPAQAGRRTGRGPGDQPRGLHRLEPRERRAAPRDDRAARGFAGGPIVGNNASAPSAPGRCWTTRTATTCSVAGAARLRPRLQALQDLRARRGHHRPAGQRGGDSCERSLFVGSLIVQSGGVEKGRRPTMTPAG